MLGWHKSHFLPKLSVPFGLSAKAGVAIVACLWPVGKFLLLHSTQKSSGTPLDVGCNLNKRANILRGIFTRFLESPGDLEQVGCD